MIKEKKKTGNNYFDEELVSNLIFDYQKSAIREKNSEGIETVVWKDERLEELITLEVLKIVKAIIQVYRYYIFEPYDDCLQHGIMSCYTNFMKWTPEKGTCFNFFSIISKRSLLNYTDRKKRHRNLSDIDDHTEIHAKAFSSFDHYIEHDLKTTLIEIVNENYVGKMRKRFLSISVILSDYLLKTKKYVSKTDFYSWARSYGMRSIDIREFVKEISKHDVELFNGTDKHDS